MNENERNTLSGVDNATSATSVPVRKKKHSGLVKGLVIALCVCIVTATVIGVHYVVNYEDESEFNSFALNGMRILTTKESGLEVERLDNSRFMVLENGAAHLIGVISTEATDWFNDLEEELIPVEVEDGEGSEKESEPYYDPDEGYPDIPSEKTLIDQIYRDGSKTLFYSVDGGGITEYVYAIFFTESRKGVMLSITDDQASAEEMYSNISFEVI